MSVVASPTAESDAPPTTALLLCTVTGGESAQQIITYDDGSFVVRGSEGELRSPVDEIVTTLFDDGPGAATDSAHCLVALGLQQGTACELFSFAARQGQWVDVTHDGTAKVCSADDVRQELIGALVTLMRCTGASVSHGGATT